jgi:hypothetical protein
VYLPQHGPAGFFAAERSGGLEKGAILHSILIGYMTPNFTRLGRLFNQVQKSPWNTQGIAVSSSTLFIKGNEVVVSCHFSLRASFVACGFRLGPLASDRPPVAISPGYSW